MKRRDTKMLNRQLLLEYRASADSAPKKLINRLKRWGEIEQNDANQLIELMNFNLDEHIDPIIDLFQPTVRQVLEDLSGIDEADTMYSLRRLRNQDARIQCPKCDDEKAFVDVNGAALDVEEKEEQEKWGEYKRILQEEESENKEIVPGITIPASLLEKKPELLDKDSDNNVGSIICPICEEAIPFVKNRIASSQKFNRIAYWAIRSIIVEVLRNKMINGNQGYHIMKNNRNIPIKLTNSELKQKRLTKGVRRSLEEILNLSIEYKIPLRIDDEEYLVQSSATENKGSFRALTINVKDELSRKISMHVSDDLKDELGKNFDYWSQTVSMHIIYAIITHTDMIESFSPRTASTNENDDGGAGMIETNATLTEAIHSFLTMEDIEKIRMETAEDSLLPMIVEPKPWKKVDENEFDGGFILEQTRAKKRLIPSNKTMKSAGHPSFEPSDRCLEAINHLQNTAWAINKEMIPIIEDILHTKVSNHIDESLLVKWDGSGERFLISLNKTKDVSGIALDSVREWNRDIQHAKDNFDNTLYHVFNMDYRGRINTSVSRLTHQKDDVTRAMLVFDNPYKIDTRGWYWFKIHTVAAWQGRALNESWCPNKGMTLDQMEVWAERDDFIEAMKRISKTPEEHLEYWGSGDLFRSKAEGFQRLAITKEFVNIIIKTNGKGVGGESNFVLHQDASSNIYQHMAMLLRDKEMGGYVNVLPNDDRIKMDIYQEIAKKVGVIFENLIEQELPELSTEIKAVLRDYIELRATAKNPVMITGYGAGVNAIAEGFLTHNGKSGKDGGRTGFVEDIEEDGSQKRKENGAPRWKPCAHDNSKIAKELDKASERLDKQEIIARKQIEEEIALVIANAYKTAIEMILPSYKTTKDTLNKIYRKAVTDEIERPLSNEYCEKAKSFSKEIEKLKGQTKDAKNSISEKLASAINEGVTITEIINSTVGYNSKVIYLQMFCRVAGIKSGKMKKSEMIKELKNLDEKKSGDVINKILIGDVRDAIIEFDARNNELSMQQKTQLDWMINTVLKDEKVLKTPKPKIKEKDGKYIIKATIMNPNSYLKWVLPDGSQVTSVKIERADSISISIPEYILDEKKRIKKLNKHIDANLKITGSHEKLSNVTILTENGEINWEEIRKALGTHNQNNQPFLHWEYDELRDDTSIPNGKAVAWFFRRLFAISKPSKSTIRILNSERAKDEQTATAPNFVHSYDACHLREVIIQISQLQEENQKSKQFWSVHDSFGVGANDVDALRNSILNNFADLYKNAEWRDLIDVKGPLDILSRQYLGENLETKDSLEIEEVAAVDQNGHVLSEWFVGP